MTIRSMTLVVALGAGTFLASSAQAAFSLAIQVGPMTQEDGAMDPLLDGTFVLYADIDGDGFGNLGTSNTYETDDADDVVLLVTAANQNGFGAGFEGIISGTFGPFDTPANTALAFGFFDDGKDGLASAPGVGADFGFVDFGYVQTNPNASGDLFAFNTLGAPQGDSESLKTNDGTVVPEPASLALLGLGGLMIAGRRRR